jgi:5,6-dimethylbenzimidazole synthase
MKNVAGSQRKTFKCLKKEERMDVFTAMKNRRSCREFSTEPIKEEIINKILEAATWAPSPLNSQPWEFVVVTNEDIRKRIYGEAERCRNWAIEKSGWKWLENYRADFLQSAPVIICVIGDPKKTGVDMFQEEGMAGYQLACAAAIQNMLLTAHALGISSLWFTFFDKKEIRGILDIDIKKTPLALVCLGKASGEPTQTPRKDAAEKSRYIR